MYDHPIKRAGLTFNRILFSNSRMVLPCLPPGSDVKFKIQFKMKNFDQGKEISRRYFTIDHIDELFPPRK